jgi:hypothetical protein
LEKDTDLASLRGDPRWPGLLVGLQAMQAREALQWKSPALATPWREALSEDERVAGLSRLWSEAKFNFVNFDKVPDLDWDALYIATLPKVRAARSTTDYYRELEVFMAHLHDGHSGVWPAMDRLDTMYARPGLETRLVEGRVMVDAVIDERLAAMGITPAGKSSPCKASRFEPTPNARSRLRSPRPPTTTGSRAPTSVPCSPATSEGRLRSASATGAGARARSHCRASV